MSSTPKMDYHDALRVIAERTSFRTEEEQRDALAALDDYAESERGKSERADKTEPEPEPEPEQPGDQVDAKQPATRTRSRSTK